MPGTELTVKGLTREHATSVGTAQKAIARLAELGVVVVRIGRPTVVAHLPARTPPAAATTAVPRDSGRVGEPQPAHVASAGRPELPQADTPPQQTALRREAVGEVVTLELWRLGVLVRSMRARADLDDFDTMQRLLLDAVRRSGGDPADVGDYELAVRRADDPKPVTIVVVAA